MRHLAEAWLQTTRRVHARGDVAFAGAELLGRYAEAHRHYHDLAHLDDVLRGVDRLAHLAAAPDVVRLAAWYHDAVYDPARADNEEQSARLAQVQLAGLRVEDSVAGEVARLVRATADHLPAPGDLDGAVLCDADLAILAGDEVAYGRYVDAVREEYGHLDDATFARGRGAVLRALLDRDRLFSTSEGQAAWERAARANVAAELARLDPPAPAPR